MDTVEFAALLAQLAQRPIPPLLGRHVYLWHGEPADLHALVPIGLAAELDLYALAATLPKTPFALDEARRLLQTAVAAWLRDHAPAGSARQVVVVTGSSLLQRYRVPLDAFFQATGETRLVVFAVSPRETGFRSARPMPAYVELDPGSTFAYLRAKVGDHALIGETNP